MLEKIRNIDRQQIAAMIDECSGYTTAELVDLTYRQSPWMDSYKRYSNNIITDESIYEFFKN